MSGLLLLLLASWIAFGVYFKRQKKLVAGLIAARQKIEVEESRVFEFLHGLGEAFSADIRPEELHRLIVEGARRILNARGGILYLADPKRSVLVARFISKHCPALVKIPDHILEQALISPQAVQGYVRLHSIPAGDGLLGNAWSEKEALLLRSDDPRLTALAGSVIKPGSVVVAPLTYAQENLGVLAVVNAPNGREFSESDFAVFKAIAEQSAFALYNAYIYAEAHEKRRLDDDLQVAQDIQRILLPSSAPTLSGFEISGSNIPAKQVSGDYFDFIPLGENRLGVAIADVSGKGVPASLIMAMCRSVLHSHADSSLSAASVLQKVNHQLFPDIKEDMFISMAYLLLEGDSNRVTLSRAGHDAPLHYSAREQVIKKINPPGMALGIDSGDVFNRITGDFSVTLEQDDCLILYTDGVTEALDSKGMEFGMSKMIESIQASASTSAGGVIERLTHDLLEFIGASPRNDDITLIVIRKT